MKTIRKVELIETFRMFLNNYKHTKTEPKMYGEFRTLRAVETSILSHYLDSLGVEWRKEIGTDMVEVDDAIYIAASLYSYKNGEVIKEFEKEVQRKVMT